MASMLLEARLGSHRRRDGRLQGLEPDWLEAEERRRVIKK